jgi:Protein of unknown function DUF262
VITPRLMTLQDLFGDRIFYEVPIYQRPYVWNLDDQWQPLWEDISNLATARLTGQQVLGHFLGAIVIELMSAEPGRVKEVLRHRRPAAPDHASDRPCSASIGD